MKYAARVVIPVLALAVLIGCLADSAPCEARGSPRLAAHADRGESYRQALAVKAATREASRAAARRAAEKARAERREAAQVAYFSRLYGSRVGRWYPLVHRWFPGHERDALYVMRGESRGDERADNGSCRGLWQVHQSHAAAFRRITGESYFWGVFDPVASARMVAHMTNGGRGWSAWSVKP